MKNVNKTLQKLRENAWYTQDDLAEMLDISRVTLANIESGKRDAMDFLDRYSIIFDIPAEAIKQGITEIPHINAMPGNTEKFKELLLYILHRIGIKPNIWKTVLYKLLYFCDFDYFEKYGKSITGMQYIKLPMGPAPYKFDVITMQMQKDNELLSINSEYGGYRQQKYFPNRNYQQIFSAQELEVIERVLKNLSDAKASEISEYSHHDKPREMTKDMEIINYSLTKKREYPYSISQRTQKKQEAQQFAKASWFFDDLANDPDLYEDYR